MTRQVVQGKSIFGESLPEGRRRHGPPYPSQLFARNQAVMPGGIDARGAERSGAGQVLRAVPLVQECGPAGDDLL